MEDADISSAAAVAELRRCAGSQFDAVVGAFYEALTEPAEPASTPVGAIPA